MSNVVPEGWMQAKLNEISKVSIGLVTSMTKHYVESGVPLIRNSDIKENKVRQSKLIYLNPEFANENSSRSIFHKDIVTVHTGNIGTSAVVPKELDGCQGFATINTRVNQSIIDPYYLSWFFNTDSFTSFCMSVSTGDGRSNLNLKDFIVANIVYPPLPEQQKIAAILSSVDEVIEKTHARINKLKALKTGVMQELLSPREGQAANKNSTQGESKSGLLHTEFKDSPLGRIPVGWEVKSFSDIFELKNGVNKGKDFFGNGVPIISYRNVYDRDGITDEKITGLVEMNESELSRFHSQYGDIFITRTSETPDEIGYANIYLGCRSDVVFSGFVIRARQITEVLNPIYSLYAFQTHSIREQMIHNSKFTTRAGISGESLYRLKMVIPTMDEQNKIADALTSITNRIDSLEIKNKSTKSMKKALMQDLLTGKVRVQVHAA